MKLIALTQGMFTQVDDSDYEWLNQWKWTHDDGYAVRSVWVKGRKSPVYTAMARVIMGCVPHDGIRIDHIDLNGLNNQRWNLRFANASQNSANRVKRRDNTSGFKGVTWQKDANQWAASIGFNKRHIKLGYAHTAEEAARLYDDAAIKYFGEFARLNFPKQVQDELAAP